MRGMADARDFDLEAGTTALYKDPTYYDYEYKDRVADVRWYAERYVEAEGPALELGVGTGRIALRAVREGATVTGVDLSTTMLERIFCRRLRCRRYAVGSAAAGSAPPGADFSAADSSAAVASASAATSSALVLVRKKFGCICCIALMATTVRTLSRQPCAN